MSESSLEPGGRERWHSRTAFIMAAVGSAVGLGNVWRFPYMVYQNGGGAFFIPYIIALITAGIPLLILEYGVGQMFQGSAPKALRRANRNYEWLGWFALSVGTVISIYYAAIMAYAWEYLWNSFQFALPWADEAGKFFEEDVLALPTASRAEFVEHMWEFRPAVAIGLALTWVIVFLIIFKGVKNVGRVVLITVPLPVILLGVLAVRGMTLPGAFDGIEYYLKPDFRKLSDPGVWLAAYGQIFFSLSLGFGIMIAYASYNKRRGDITNNAFITSLANCATSFFAGFVVFSVLGFLAFSKDGVPIEKVATDGPGLAFVTYPEAIARLGDYGRWWPPVVAVLFFITLLTLGIDSLFSIVEGVVAGLHDRFPFLKRWMVTAGFCGVGLSVGLGVFARRGGIGWVGIFDHWANYGLAIVGLIECLLIGYFFRTARLREYINAVSEIHLGGWWELCIRLLVPLSLIVFIGSSLWKEVTDGLYGSTGQFEALTAEGVKEGFPDFMLYAGAAALPVLAIVAFLLGKRWSLVLAVVIGGVFFAVLLAACGLSASASAAGAIALMILLGGLAICIAIALRGKDVEHHEQAHGWPERERLEHLTAAEDAQDE